MNSVQTSEKLRNAISYFLYRDSELLCDGYMRANFTCMIDSITDSEPLHQLLIIHPGTKHILNLAIVLMAVCSLVDGEDIDVSNFFSKFHAGDKIIRGSERYYYHGIVDGECILTSDDTKNSLRNKTRIPIEDALNIRPYRGQAVSTGKYKSASNANSVARLLERIIGVEFKKRIAVMPRSILVLCDRDKANDIANDIFVSDNGENLRFADIFPCVWASSSEEWSWHYYLGSVGKSYPVVIFTNRVYIAREIMYNDENDSERIFSVIIDNLVDNVTEQEIRDIHEIMERKEHCYFWMFQSEDRLSSINTSIYESFQKILFWTPELLISTINHLYSEPQSLVDNEISSILRRSVDSEADRFPVTCGTELQGLTQCRNLLKRMIRSRQPDDNLDEFILCSYGLLNLFEQSCFPLELFEQKIDVREIQARSPQNQIKKLYEIYDQFTNPALQDLALPITLCLASCYDFLLSSNPKYATLIELLHDASQSALRTLIVVTKKSFLPIVEDICNDYPSISVSLISSLPNEVYDQIIFIATPNPKRDGINPLGDKRADRIIVLEYPSEGSKNSYYQRKIATGKENVTTTANTYASAIFDVETDTLQESEYIDNTENEREESEEEIIASEIELTNIETDVIINHAVAAYHDSASNSIRVTRLAQFQTGECALFSRNYKGYSVEGDSLIEKPVGNFQIGDELVFPASSEEICDIVDIYLKQLVDNDPTLRAHYNRSIRWKQVLQDYIERTGCTYREIAESMAQLGHERHQQTVKHWLDEDNSTVGPHDTEAYLAIGLVAEDIDMQEHYEQYKESCDCIRRYRIKILNHLQKNAIRSVHYDLSADEKLSASELQLLSKAKQYTKRLIIERIVPCEREAPSYLVNRPIDRR